MGDGGKTYVALLSYFMHKAQITNFLTFIFYNHIYIASSLQITTCVTVRLPVAFAVLGGGAGGRRGSDLDLLETCRAEEGRELLLADQGGWDLAGETGGRIAGWMEKEEDYNFFFLSPSRAPAGRSLMASLLRHHPPPALFLFHS